MSVMRKILHFLGLSSNPGPGKYEEDDEGYVYEESWSEEERYDEVSANQNVVSLQAVKQHAKLILMEPHTYEEAQEVADHLKSRRAVVLNLQRLHHEQAKRVVDFLSGTVYAIGGEIQKVGTDIFLCTPDNIAIQGSITDFIPEEFQSRMR